MEGENNFLTHFGAGHWLITTPDVPGPTTWVDGEPNDTELATMARLTVRYSDCPEGGSTPVIALRDEESRPLGALPRMPEAELESLRIR